MGKQAQYSIISLQRETGIEEYGIQWLVHQTFSWKILGYNPLAVILIFGHICSLYAAPIQFYR